MHLNTTLCSFWLACTTFFIFISCFCTTYGFHICSAVNPRSVCHIIAATNKNTISKTTQLWQLSPVCRPIQGCRCDSPTLRDTRLPSLRETGGKFILSKCQQDQTSSRSSVTRLRRRGQRGPPEDSLYKSIAQLHTHLLTYWLLHIFNDSFDSLLHLRFAF